jgi:UDP-N-acetylmuramoyl-tripeptide--D-alanyl-D-alanine ligase
MEATTLETLARWSRGEVVAGDPAATVTTICTDSRTMKAGDLFLALHGEKFDGHSFVLEAARRGALGAVIDQPIEGLPQDFCVLRVQNTLYALQRIAGEYRKSLSLQVVCITGSNGKTSTKDLISAVLRERFQITRTEGNLNNHIGLPLTILKARASDQIGVFEIGMNHPGEIAPLAALARPDVAVVTNIGVAHIEHMGSRDAIALEKGALVEALAPSGTVVLNSDDEYSHSIASKTKADAIFCGGRPSGDGSLAGLFRDEISTPRIWQNRERPASGPRRPHGSQRAARGRCRTLIRNVSRGGGCRVGQPSTNEGPPRAEGRTRHPVAR